MEDNNDIVYLNVGGTKMATKRSILCQIEGSLLAAMFSGRWEDNVERDEDGHAFLDYNPELFASVLDYLRAKKIETPSKPAILPPVALEDTVNFRNLVDYLGVCQNIQNNPQRAQASGESINDTGKLQFELHSEGLVLENNGTVARHKMGTNCHEFVIGKHEATGEIRWRFNLNFVQPNSKLFVGVLDTSCRNSCVSESLTQRENYIHVPPVYEWEGSYGWVLGENFQTCSNGHVLNTYTFGALGKQNDIIELHLKTKTSDIPEYTNTQVSLFLHPSGVKRCIPLPNARAWQCVIGSYYAGDSISLIS